MYHMDTIWQIIVRLACPAVLRPWVNGDNTARDNHYLRFFFSRIFTEI